MFASATSISMELFTLPHHHHPLDPIDGTIPTNHLQNFEHANISLSIFTYAFFAILLDKVGPPARTALTYTLAAVMLAEELLLFHLHSTDHMGLQGQYHWLQQIVIFTSLATSIVSIKYSKSFILSFTRSLSICSQGVWMILIGFMLYIPSVIPKGCSLGIKDGHYVVHCHEKKKLDRAKSLANILFGYYVVGMSVFGLIFYLAVVKAYSKGVEYRSLMEENENHDEEEQDVEGQKEETCKSFVQLGSLLHLYKC